MLLTNADLAHKRAELESKYDPHFRLVLKPMEPKAIIQTASESVLLITRNEPYLSSIELDDGGSRSTRVRARTKAATAIEADPMEVYHKWGSSRHRL